MVSIRAVKQRAYLRMAYSRVDETFDFSDGEWTINTRWWPIIRPRQYRHPNA